MNAQFGGAIRRNSERRNPARQVSLNGADYSSSKASFLYDDNWHEPRFSGAAPPALEGSAAAAVGKTIYYFGGADIAQMAEVGEPFISEMYALNTDTMQV